jgi:hypothetical protein
MGGRRRLRGGLVRVFPDHRSALGQEYRREFDSLVRSLELAGTELITEAARVAELRVRAHYSGAAWADAVEQRRVGRGRRPSERRLERLSRRAALDDASATAASDRLRELAGRHGHGDPLADVKRAVAEANRT